MNELTDVRTEGIITRDELLAMGCTEYRARSGRKGYVIDGEGVAAECIICDEVKRREYFPKFTGAFLGLGTRCGSCVRRRNSDVQERQARKARKNYVENREWILEQSRIYKAENRERINKAARKHYAENPYRYAIYAHNRRARKLALPDELTVEQLTEINASFYNTCALTGEPADLHADHVMPLSIGHGGTTYGNTVPLSATLNKSKSDAHIFEWFELNRERFGLSQDKFDALIEWLAQANEMTTQEYRKYVDWCFDNPREVCEKTGDLVFIDGPINERVTKS